MARQSETEGLVSQVNEATNQVAQTLEGISQKLEGGVTPEEAVELQKELEGARQHLETLGSDPENPVPDAETVGPEDELTRSTRMKDSGVVYPGDTR